VNPKLPQVKAKELVRVASKLGFEFDRQSGSHAIYYRKSDKKRIVVPIHPGKDLKPKTLFGIIKDMGVEVNEFRELL
jgi:predicted RNA binding protein YcfA (HicA-like mRNA interferase family)